VVERNKQVEQEPDPKYVPYFFDPKDADQTPETLKRWRREHLINVGIADTMEMRKWHLSQAVRFDLALIAAGILPEIPTGVLPPTPSSTELINESGLTEDEALARYYAQSVKDQETLANPMSEPDDEVGMDLYGEAAEMGPAPKVVDTKLFGAERLRIISQPTAAPTSKDERTAYDCGCVYNRTQRRWDFHCMLFNHSRCPNVESQKAREEAQKQVVNGNSVTNCPRCLVAGNGVVRMEYQAATQWKCPVCGHWENITPDAQRYQPVPLEIDDQPACGCLWPYKYCTKCRPAYEAWWHRQVDAGLLNEVACPLENTRGVAQVEAQKEAEQETQDPFALTPTLRGVLEHEKRLRDKIDTSY